MDVKGQLLGRLRKQFKSRESARAEESPIYGGRVNAILAPLKIEDLLSAIIQDKTYVKEKKLVYVSYNKMSTYTREVLEDQGVNLGDIAFVDCVENGGSGSKVDPRNLTDISIRLDEVVSQTGASVVIIDNVSSFTAYHKRAFIEKFVASMNNKARSRGYCIIWVAINDPDERGLNDSLAVLCDKTIKTEKEKA